MKQLFIEQNKTTGEKKVWRLGAEKRQYTFGTSRTADIVSIDASVDLWEGLFEFENGEWRYVSMNSNSHKLQSGPVTIIDSKKEVKFKSSSLFLSVLTKDVEINQFRLEPISQVAQTKKFQVFQVSFEDQVIETQIIPFSKKFIPKSLPETSKIDSIPSASWHVSKMGDFTVKQKSIDVEKPSTLFFLKYHDLVDRDAFTGLLSLLVLCLLFLTGYFLIPKTEKYIPVSKKAMATRIFVTELPKKEKAKIQVKDETKKSAPPVVEAPKMQAAAADSQPAKTNVAGVIKTLNSGRLSSLISKVSAQSQKSRTVVISDGVAAGTASSGRALAGIGKIEKSGSDWSHDNGSKGFKISTNGIGGGKNINSFATLSGGKVGKGGVGLIEDESEISGGLDREEIASYIRTQLGQILYCYERQLSANKELFGKVSVKFTINGAGKVETQTVNDTTLKNATVEGCMLNKIASWKFPVPRGGTKVIVTYPFLFKSTN